MNIITTIKSLGIGATALALAQIQMPVMAKMPTATTNYFDSSAAYSACRSYQSRNPSVGYLINARTLGNGKYSCDFSRVCLRVNAWGQQASLSVTGLQLAKKVELETLIQTTN
jgi:hypothetical protein